MAGFFLVGSLAISLFQGRFRVHRMLELRSMELKRLSDLDAMERGTLTRVDATEGMLALMEMGCVVGEDIEVRHIAPLGDPMAVSTGGQVVTLRKAQAEQMWILPVS